MLVKTVYRTVLSHLWTEIFSKIFLYSITGKPKNVSEDRLPHCSIPSVERDIHKNHRKVAETKHRKVLLANFNFSILGGFGDTFFLLLFCRKKKYAIFVNILFNR